MTLEPVDAPASATRVLLEHRTRRLRAPSADVGNHLVSLITLLHPAPDARLMVEIAQCDGTARPLRIACTHTVHVAQAPFPATPSGPHRDSRGDWDWSLLLRDLPLERGGCTVRISGHALPECLDYALVPLDAYWTRPAEPSDLIGAP